MSFVLNTYSRLPLTIVKGKGCRVWDQNEREYLDFSSGIAVCSLGHSPQCMVDAICRQAAQLIHCSNLYHIPQQEDLAQLLVEEFVKLPGQVFFANSGAEANEGLIKTARRYGHQRPQADGSPRYEVITFEHSFHGRTLGTLTATGQEKVKTGFDPLPIGFRHLPFNDLETLQKSIRPETVAILLEPIQGEGGVHPATVEFLRGIDELCKKYDLLLLFDEVQAGLGRCGETMAWRSILPELKPHGVSWAKGIGGGFPISAFWLSDTAPQEGAPAPTSVLTPGSHATTYGGSPLACATSLAVLHEILGQDLIANVRERSTQFHETVRSWNHPLLHGVRGTGLLLGLALKSEHINFPEDSAASVFLTKKLLQNGLLAVPAGTETLRLLPPLNVTEEEVDEALALVRRTLDDLPTK